MARTLQVNVQIDQLPKIFGDTNPYVGVRLSAWIGIDGPDQALASDWHMLVPWEWSTADLNTPGDWNPGDRSSWKAWWVDPTQHPPTIIDAQFTPIINPDALHPPPAVWQQPRDKMLAGPPQSRGTRRIADPSDGVWLRRKSVVLSRAVAGTA